jgi:hypothetical protein
MFSRSALELTRPTPRTTNSIPFSSITLPPTFKLLCFTASMTICSVTFIARIRSDETSI